MVRRRRPASEYRRSRFARGRLRLGPGIRFCQSLGERYAWFPPEHGPSLVDVQKRVLLLTGSPRLEQNVCIAPRGLLQQPREIDHRGSNSGADVEAAGIDCTGGGDTEKSPPPNSAFDG